MLNEIAKSRVRVHLGVPVAGIQQTGSQLGARFNQTVGQLEYRMNNMQPLEESQLTGVPSAVIGISGHPAVGDSLTLTINAFAAIAYTVTAPDVAAQIPVQSISQNTAAAVTLARQGFLGNYGIPPTTSPPVLVPYNGLILIASASNDPTPFTIAVASTGGSVAYIMQQGIATQPSVTFQETGVTANGYIGICDYLESATANASDLVKYTKADIAQFRPNELAERRAIYEHWVDRLAEFLGIPRYPMGKPHRAGGSMNTGMDF